MTHNRFKNALDAIEVMIDSNEAVYLDIAGEHENAVREALTLAQEAEQLRKERDELQAKLDKAKWRDINYAPTDVWVLINVSGEVVRAIKRDSSGIYCWFPHDPEGRSGFTWATDMVLGWMPLPDAPEKS